MLRFELIQMGLPTVLMGHHISQEKKMSSCRLHIKNQVCLKYNVDARTYIIHIKNQHSLLQLQMNVFIENNNGYKSL